MRFPNALSRDDGLQGAHQVHGGHAPPSPRVSGTFGRVFTGFSSGSKEMSDAFCEVGRCFRKG